MRTLVVAVLITSLLAGCTAPSREDVLGPPPPEHPLSGSTFTWEPYFPTVGEPVWFRPTVRSSASGDGLLGLKWAMDGEVSTDTKPVHTFWQAGDHEVSLTIQTSQGGRYTLTDTVEVLPADGARPDAPRPPTPGSDVAPPVIHADVNLSRVQFSFDFDGEAQTVHWDLGDGTIRDEPRFNHTYGGVGTYNVSLRLLASSGIHEARTQVAVEEVSFEPRVVVGMTDSGINPYHLTYHRPGMRAHPCTYVVGYEDCSVQALDLTLGPDGGSYQERLRKDADVWASVKQNTWYWIPQTNIIAVHCPEPYGGDATDTGTYDDPVCILDDTQTHGTQTTSSMLSEAPDALLVFNEGSGSPYLAGAPVPIDIESNSWGSLAPLYAGFTHAVGVDVCNDSIDSRFSIKFRSAGNNGPVPNMGDCWRNGYRTYSVGGGYPEGQHGYLSGSAPDFSSYWCRPAADPHSVAGMLDSICGTSFAAPTAAGTAAAALLELRRELGYLGGSSATEVAPGITHEAFMDAVAQAATYDPTPRPGFPSSSTSAYPTGPTPWLYWGWGWLHAEQVPRIVDCAMGRDCPDNKSVEAWTFNDVRRSFAADTP